MAQMYERFIRILQRWPVDDTKRRCLGLYLREQGKIAFTKTGEVLGNKNECSNKLDSLERLAKNHWRDQFPRQLQSSASGLNLEDCRRVLSKEFVDIYESQSSWTGRLITTVKALFTKSG